jgi:hypothetical protein
MWTLLRMAVVVCVLAGVSTAHAQTHGDYRLSQPESVRQAAFTYTLGGPSGEVVAESGAASASPSDIAAPAEVAAESYATPAVPGYAGNPQGCGPCLDSGWGGCGCRACGDYGCGYTCAAKKSNPFNYGGWVSAGIYANAWGAKYNGPLTMREYGNGATVDQTWFYFEKAIDNGGCGFDWGGRVDFIWGADGPDTQCFGDGGWDGRWFTSKDDNYGSALPQLYGELAYNDTSVKIGHFYTIIGYEVVPAPDNFFYSHSDIMAFEPFTHMGALVTHKWNDRVTFHGGWVNGWDNGWLNPSGASAFLGGATLELTEKSTLTYATSFGTLWDTKNSLGGVVTIDLNNTGYLHSIVLETKLTPRLTYVLQSDFLTRRFDVAIDYQAIPDVAYRIPSRVYGVNQYLFYEINEKLLAGMRVEWLRNEEAIDYGQAGRISQSYNTSALTLGLNVKPTSNIVFRPEIRWDWYEGAPLPVFPFNDNSNSYQFSGGFDMIVTF